ncbi:hypothetical protein BV25DRAFT_1911916 [Artomyces pyxidatus]|uniref:Uncharacterized protein n=1 Tax=Artomyces pyxidatus TaxID=48021 RepID=A0ACB8TFN7_9AGAM|nr:hypothetical protein BV25DRAFT_1911916 [Artomyces pyxidatus]
MPSSPRWKSPPPVYDSRPAAHSALTPYLQLPHLISLTWLAYPILSLLFIVFRLLLSSDSAQTAVSNAKGDLLTSCQAAQQAASSTASMPRFMAIATNQQIADAVNGTMNGAREALILALTIMETIINFIVDIYRSTFLCFLELVVRGGLSLLIGATQEISSFLTSTFSTIRTSIQNDVASANSIIASAVNGINKINPFGNISVPQFSIPSLSALDNVTLPTDFTDALVKLNASLPSVSQLKNDIDDIIDTPFELVKQDINNTFFGISFNSSILPIPDRSSLNFCDNMDTSVVDDLGRDLLKITKIGIILLVVFALALVAGNCALEWYRWRCLKRHLEYTRQAWQSDPTVIHSGSSGVPSVDLSDHNLLVLQVDAAHPLLTRIANQIAGFLHLSPSQHIQLRWFFHYVFHPPALACFLIGVFGILSVQAQLFAIRPLEAKYQAQATGAANDFSAAIFTSLNASMYNQSSLYANDINGRVDVIQSTINDGLFGWVNGTTSTLNDTLNTFYSDIQNTVTTVFNGTILQQPALEFIQCFIGSKVDAFEAALTFLHDNLKVNMPRVNESVLVLSPDQIDEATQPIAAAAIGGNSDNGKEGLVGRLVNTYVESLKKERIMFAIFLGLWMIVVFMAIGIILWHSYGHDFLEARRKRQFRREQRSDFNSIVTPFRSTSTDGAQFRTSNEKVQDLAQVQLPSFTPMPSPKPPGGYEEQGGQPNDGNHLRAGHPLTNLLPNLGKSFDSFFDHAWPAPAPAPPPNAGKKNVFTKGFTMRGARTDTVDAEKAGQSSQDEDNDGWWKRVTRTFWARDEATRRSFRRAHRPQLTISTDRASSLRDATLPVIETTSPSIENEPASAWSISPGLPPPRAKPWVNPIAPTRKQTGPTHPKPRRNVSVPVDVGGSTDDVFAMMESKSSHLAVPLHHGFNKPIAPPPPTRRPYAPPPGLAPPPQRKPAADPFVTPFDDEARVSTADATRFSIVTLDDPFSGRAF